MKAIAQYAYGSPDVLNLREIGTPELGDGEVLVRVRAAGVNSADWAIMSGLPYIARPVYGLRKPKNAIRVTDMVGAVKALGVSWRDTQSGDEFSEEARTVVTAGGCTEDPRL